MTPLKKKILDTVSCAHSFLERDRTRGLGACPQNQEESRNVTNPQRDNVVQCPQNQEESRNVTNPQRGNVIQCPQNQKESRNVTNPQRGNVIQCPQNQKESRNVTNPQRDNVIQCPQNQEESASAIGNQKKPLICLMGPTASGKTHLAIELVQHFPFEIISVDSALVYRGMNIGTAKPNETILKMAPHHLIDICDPAEPYSAAQFREDALREMKNIYARKKIPLFVGGTMLYFQALQKGLAVMPSADPHVRAQLSAEAEIKGWAALHARLEMIDPAAAAHIHPNDSQRIQRALEVYIVSGKNRTHWQQEQEAGLLGYEIHNLIVAPIERSILHARIAARFKHMLENGLIDEVKKLYARHDLNEETPAMRSVGYRQVWAYLAGQYSFDEMQEKAIIATRQLAKRQLTRLRRWPNAVWFDSEAKDLFETVALYVSMVVLF
jgi:tRNA dimethylallyltransferase